MKKMTNDILMNYNIWTSLILLLIVVVSSVYATLKKESLILTLMITLLCIFALMNEMRFYGVMVDNFSGTIVNNGIYFWIALIIAFLSLIYQIIKLLLTNKQ